MNTFVIFSAILACTLAAPGYYHDDEYLPIAKTTFTKSNQLENHGSAYIHTPLVSVVHTPVSSKTTITKSSQVVNHGGHEVVHAPVVHAAPVFHTPVVHTPVVHAPVVHASLIHEAKYYEPAKSSQYFHLDNTEYHTNALIHSPVVHTPVVVKSGDSAITHHSSTVHETVPVVKHLPFVSYYHH